MNLKGSFLITIFLVAGILFGAGYLVRGCREGPPAVQALTAERAAHVEKIRSIDQQLINEYAKLDSLYYSRLADPDSAARAILERYRPAGYPDPYGGQPVIKPDPANNKRVENLRRMPDN